MGSCPRGSHTCGAAGRGRPACEPAGGGGGGGPVRPVLVSLETALSVTRWQVDFPDRKMVNAYLVPTSTEQRGGGVLPVLGWNRAPGEVWRLKDRRAGLSLPSRAVDSLLASLSSGEFATRRGLLLLPLGPRLSWLIPLLRAVRQVPQYIARGGSWTRVASQSVSLLEHSSSSDDASTRHGFRGGCLGVTFSKK